MPLKPITHKYYKKRDFRTHHTKPTSFNSRHYSTHMEYNTNLDHLPLKLVGAMDNSVNNKVLETHQKLMQSSIILKKMNFNLNQNRMQPSNLRASP